MVLTGGVALTAIMVLTTKSMKNTRLFYVLVVLTGGVALTAVTVLTAIKVRKTLGCSMFFVVFTGGVALTAILVLTALTEIVVLSAKK